jgi:multiple sugar transport system ATP-binding protein
MVCGVIPVLNKPTIPENKSFINTYLYHKLASPSMPHLELQNLTKIFSQKVGESIVAIEDLDVSMEEGEFLVLVGPSGCGKSTTLRCVAGLEDITDGKVIINGREVNDLSPSQRDIAMVFQNYALYPQKTARENMAFGLKMTTNLSKEEIADRVNDAAEMMNIEDLLDQKPKQLSGGQQQRVALGRAIVREPEVFLLDEPLSNLDAKLRSHMRTEIQRIQNELDITTIYVTHDQTEAMTMGDRIAVLNEGELQQLGTPLECYHEPANLFVAGFIGDPAMNFFELQRQGDSLVNNAITYPLSERVQDQLGNTESVTFGIRPEDIRLAEEDGEYTYTGTIEVVEPLGDDNNILVNINGLEATLSLEGNIRVNEGDIIRLDLHEDRAHFFDTSTGDAILNRDFSEQSISNAAITQSS